MELRARSPDANLAGEFEGKNFLKFYFIHMKPLETQRVVICSPPHE